VHASDQPAGEGEVWQVLEVIHLADRPEKGARPRQERTRNWDRSRWAWSETVCNAAGQRLATRIEMQYRVADNIRLRRSLRNLWSTAAKDG
jgi:hypothetical protein